MKKKLLLCSTGSFQLDLINDIHFALIKFQIRVVLTERAKHFVNIQEISTMAEVFTDQSEWHITKGLSEQSLHLELVQWADFLVISPLDANTLGKISSGICDNLLTCIARAWDLHKPLLFCPEMNTKMFLHPITSKQIEELKIYGYYELPSISETLLTDSSGAGALSEINYIIDAIFNHVQKMQNQQNNYDDNSGLSFEQKFNNNMNHNNNASQSSTPSISPTSSVLQHLTGFVQVKQRNTSSQSSSTTNPEAKPFECDICGGKFSRYSSLWSHKTLHTGVKKFTCNVCNASFAKANYLNNHKRTHSG